jgi:phenylacetate-CoA ligase
MNILPVLPASAVRLLRKGLLAYARRMDMERMRKTSERGALRMALQASQHSEAYRTLLQESGISPASLSDKTHLAALPVLTKTNTFARFSLRQLARPCHPSHIGDVLTSSGRSGLHFGCRLTLRTQHEAAWFGIDLGLQDAFKVDQVPTLLVNCLPMGVVFNSHAVTVANVSVREDMACSILRDAGPLFSQTLLCTDPLFVRRLLSQGQASGVDWKSLNTSVILGEEVLVEAQRDYLAARMCMDPDHEPHRMIGSSFGIGELGLNLLFETRETIRLRRAARTHTALATLLRDAADHNNLPTVFCFNPLRCHVEVLNPSADGFGELCFTLLDPQSLIMLPRYASGDRGKLLSPDEAGLAAQAAGITLPWLPMVCVAGRIKDRIPGVPSVERIKDLLYRQHAVADQLTGAFRLGRTQDGRVQLRVQTIDLACAKASGVQAQLQSLLASLGLAHLSLELVTHLTWPGQPPLDYERKFPYLAQPEV